MGSFNPFCSSVGTHRISGARGFDLRRCVARVQKLVHASILVSTVDRLFRATVNVRRRRACVRVARLLPKL